MKVFSWNELNDQLQNGCQNSLFSGGSGICVGSFDGLHNGHKILLNTLISNCKKKNLKAGVISFSRPLPSIKKSSDYEGDISTLNQRLNLFEEIGLDFAIIVDFNEKFAAMSGNHFFSILIKMCNMKLLAEGTDFRCGYKGATGIKEIKQFCSENNIQLHLVEPVFFTQNNEKFRISSSIIRKFIKEGKLSTVEKLLGRSFELDLQDSSSIQVQPGQKVD